MEFRIRSAILFAFALILSACGNNASQPNPVPTEKPPVQSPPVTDNSSANTTVSGMYANDLGPAKADEKRIPADLKDGYRLLNSKCSKCHPSARPLNAQYIEADDAFRAKLLASNPKALDDSRLLKLESDSWRRLVKRMMAKPGNEISFNEAKKIHGFLVWYYLDKVGTNGVAAESWINHRKELLEEFKKKHPARYKELYEK